MLFWHSHSAEKKKRIISEMKMRARWECSREDKMVDLSAAET